MLGNCDNLLSSKQAAGETGLLLVKMDDERGSDFERRVPTNMENSVKTSSRCNSTQSDGEVKPEAFGAESFFTSPPNKASMAADRDAQSPILNFVTTLSKLQTKHLLPCVRRKQSCKHDSKIKHKRCERKNKKHPTISRKKGVPSEAKPSRPLSAYNIFFREQRAQIVSAKLAIDKHQQMMMMTSSLKGKAHWGAEDNQSQAPTRQKLNKGKRGAPPFFERLAKRIGSHWKLLSEVERAKYVALAQQEKQRYRDELESMHQKKMKGMYGWGVGEQATGHDGGDESLVVSNSNDAVEAPSKPSRQNDPSDLQVEIEELRRSSFLEGPDQYIILPSSSALKERSFAAQEFLQVAQGSTNFREDALLQLPHGWPNELTFHNQWGMLGISQHAGKGACTRKARNALSGGDPAGIATSQSLDFRASHRTTNHDSFGPRRGVGISGAYTANAMHCISAQLSLETHKTSTAGSCNQQYCLNSLQGVASETTRQLCNITVNHFSGLAAFAPVSGLSDLSHNENQMTVRCPNHVGLQFMLDRKETGTTLLLHQLMKSDSINH